MNKLFLITVLTLISTTAYTYTTKQICNAYYKDKLVSKATVLYYSNVDHYKIIVEDQILYFFNNSFGLKEVKKSKEKEPIRYKDVKVLYHSEDRSYYHESNTISEVSPYITSKKISRKSKWYKLKNCQ